MNEDVYTSYWKWGIFQPVMLVNSRVYVDTDFREAEIYIFTTNITSGQISSRPHTTDCPQKVVEEGKSPYFRET